MEDQSSTLKVQEQINQEITDAAKKLRDEFNQQWKDAVRGTSNVPPADVLKTALELKKDLDLILRAQKQREEELKIANSTTSSGAYITGPQITAISPKILNSTLTLPPKTDDTAMMKAQEEWLEKTQHMRVVALNEACEVAKEYIGHGESMSGTEIVRMAHMFASFLIDGKS